MTGFCVCPIINTAQYALDFLQDSETIPWSTVELDVNGNDRPHSRSAAEASHSKDSENRLRLLEMSIQNAISMVIIFCMHSALSIILNVTCHNSVCFMNV